MSKRSEQIQKIHIEKRFPIEKPETRRICISPLARSNAVLSNCFLPMPFSPSGVCARNLVGHALRMVCPLTFMLNHKLPLRSAPLHKLLQWRIRINQRSEWATYAEDRRGWKDLSRIAAYEREEAVQLSLLRHALPALPTSRPTSIRQCALTGACVRAAFANCEGGSRDCTLLLTPAV